MRRLPAGICAAGNAVENVRALTPMVGRRPGGNRMQFKHSLLIDALVILSIALVGVIAYRMQGRADLSLPVEKACLLHRQACTATLPGGGQIEVSISPRPIPTVRPVNVAVAVKGIEPSRVEVDFAGIGMNMGYNRLELSRQPDGSFAGEARLPVCVTGKMLWQATFMLETGTGLVSAPFQFEAGPA
jgi:hypothetical protein